MPNSAVMCRFDAYAWCVMHRRRLRRLRCMTSLGRLHLMRAPSAPKGGTCPNVPPLNTPLLHTTLHTTLHYVVQNIVPDFSVFYISVNRALILLCEPRFSEKPLRKGSEQSERKARAVSSAATGAPKKQRCTSRGRTKRRTCTKF